MAQANRRARIRSMAGECSRDSDKASEQLDNRSIITVRRLAGNDIPGRFLPVDSTGLARVSLQMLCNSLTPPWHRNFLHCNAMWPGNVSPAIRLIAIQL